VLSAPTLTSARRGSTAARSSSAALSSSGRRLGRCDVRLERRDLEGAAALLGVPASGVVDDEPAHHPGGVTHEPRLVGEGRAGAGRHVQIRLVQEGGRAQGQSAAAGGQLLPGHPAQLTVERREQGVCGSRVALVDRRDELADGPFHGPGPEGPPAYGKVAAPVSGSAGRLRSFR
jgi:hypothetical protein